MDILKSLNEIEDLIEYARKMMDWGEYAHDSDSFVSARLTLNNAVTKIANAKKFVKSESIVAEGE